MTTKVSVAIMAHRKRESFIPSLVTAVGPDTPVVWDTKNDRWDTGARSMLAYDPEATHHLVVQDDAIVCRDLVKGLERAAVHSGDHPVCLYTGKVRPSQDKIAPRIHQALATKSTWYEMSGPWWGVGVMVPTHLIGDMVKWGYDHPITTNYDLRMERWFTMNGLTCWYTVPSLVNHRHGPGNPSLVPGRLSQRRMAWNFIGDTVSALSIDWSPGPADPPQDGYFMAPRTSRAEWYVCWICGLKATSKNQMLLHQQRRHPAQSRARVRGQRQGGVRG